MPIAVITGTGTHALPGFDGSEDLAVETPHGLAEISRGALGGVEVLHISRHGERHQRLSNHVTHRANLWALGELGVTAVVACTVCGGVDPSLELGSLVVFDDLHFASNRLPDGSLCTFFLEPAHPRRGHWILQGGPFSDGVRSALLAAAAQAGHPARDGGAYGHVDGPRFNTRAEIAELAGCGVVAVSQTAGPEVVLAGELELPFGLIGFITDHANWVAPDSPTSLQTLSELIGASTSVFAEVVIGAVTRLDREPARAAGAMYRFDQP